MKRRSVVRAYENIRPDEAAKERMLQNILHSSEISPAEKDEMIMRKKMRPMMLIALVAVMTTTVFAAEDIAGWFRTFLERSNFVPESWSDAIIAEDYSDELLTEPVSGIPAYQFDGNGVIDLTVVSVRIRPGSLMLFYQATNSAEYKLLQDYYPGGVKVVAMDGTESILCLSGVGSISEESDSLYWVEYAADVPPMDEIVYIELANGTKLMVP